MHIIMDAVRILHLRCAGHVQVKSGSCGRLQIETLLCKCVLQVFCSVQWESADRYHHLQMFSKVFYECPVGCSASVVWQGVDRHHNMLVLQVFCRVFSRCPVWQGADRHPYLEGTCKCVTQVFSGVSPQLFCKVLCRSPVDVCE